MQIDMNYEINSYGEYRILNVNRLDVQEIDRIYAPSIL